MNEPHMQTQSLQIAASDYPATFIGADMASAWAQQTHLRLQAAYLLTLAISAAISLGASLTDASVDRWLYGLSAGLLAIGLGLLWIQRALRYDKVWFDCRAVAESVKTIAWRFMMQAPPFTSADQKQADKALLQSLSEVLQSHPGRANQIMAKVPQRAPEITDRMHELRTLDLNERIAVYRSHRLEDQEDWYCRRLRDHSRSSAKFFWLIVVFQALALGAAILHLVTGYFSVWSVPLVTTLAAALTAWSQTKRFDELSSAYATAAQELRSLRSVAGNLSTLEDFHELVEQVEEAISREHTMWCARREIRLPGSATKGVQRCD